MKLALIRYPIHETLYGYRVSPGNQPIDQLLNAVDNLYIDFDPSNPKFQALATRFLGQIPTNDQLIALITNSSQSPEFKQRLLSLLQLSVQSEPQHTGAVSHKQATTNAASGPAMIYMKRGTVISADHVIIVQSSSRPKRPRGRMQSQSRPTPHGQYVLAGIGRRPHSVWSSGIGSSCRHPDFVRIIAGVPDPNPQSRAFDPSKTGYTIMREFNRVLSIMPHNINRIIWKNGTVQQF